VRDVSRRSFLRTSGLVICGTAATPSLIGACSVQREVNRQENAPASSSVAPEQAQVYWFASENPGSVNTYWMRAPQGLVVIDSGRNVAGGRRAVAETRHAGQPVVAVVITHPHPDHVGGLGVFHEAYPRAPIYASEATTGWMRADPLGFYPLARRDDPDYPSTLTYPDQTFGPNAILDIGGLQLETAEFGPGESETATAYYEPSTGTLFSGDIINNHATPALLEGHTCGWLGNLDLLSDRFPGARVIYPGHGAPGEPTLLISQQRSYLRRYREVVEPAATAGSPNGAVVSPDEQRAIIETLNREYPGYPRVASLPTLQEYNINAVARELQGNGHC
jgi:glyoxylase-like metal-dependent hydrolase (beta-lactamase superfamily II)